MKEEDYTEQYRGIIALRKARISDEDVWFGTVGNQMISDGTFKTKKELIDNLEELTLDRVCKIVAGAFVRAITYKEVEE